MADECLFCSIRDGKVESYKVYDGEYVFAVLDIRPASLGHLLIVPKKHYSVLTQMPVNEMAQLFNVARTLIPVLIKATGAQGANILYSAGPAAGQRTPHVSLHLIPRKQDDGIVLSWKPKEFDKPTFEKMQKQIVNTLSQLGGQSQQPQTPQTPQAPAPEPEKEDKVYKKDTRPPRYW